MQITELCEGPCASRKVHDTISEVVTCVIITSSQKPLEVKKTITGNSQSLEIPPNHHGDDYAFTYFSQSLGHLCNEVLITLVNCPR